MRADRLLSLLLLLQARGRMTAAQLARELEVSERTIYRDVEALSAAGIPIYGDPGPEGGYALLENFRTNLTGLTDAEARALFMLSIPQPLTALGVSQELRSALLKLSAALPATQRAEEEHVRQRFLLDPGWSQPAEGPLPHLGEVQQAVWQDRCLQIAYRVPPLSARIEQLVDAYGLVASAGAWYLVAAHGNPRTGVGALRLPKRSAANHTIRVYRIADLEHARMAKRQFERPLNFRLADFWATWSQEREQSLSRYAVEVRVAPEFVKELPRYFGRRVQEQIEQAEADLATGALTLTLYFESLEAARNRILSFGRGVEVLEPVPLRLSVADYASQTVALYAEAVA